MDNFKLRQEIDRGIHLTDVKTITRKLCKLKMDNFLIHKINQTRLFYRSLHKIKKMSLDY